MAEPPAPGTPPISTARERLRDRLNLVSALLSAFVGVVAGVDMLLAGRWKIGSVTLGAGALTALAAASAPRLRAWVRARRTG